MDSIGYSWEWVTASRLLSHGPCELIGATLTPDAANADATLYNGENTRGTIIAVVKALSGVSHCLENKTPVYCARGLYVAEGTGVLGIFVQWRELGHEERGE